MSIATSCLPPSRLLRLCVVFPRPLSPTTQCPLLRFATCRPGERVHRHRTLVSAAILIRNRTRRCQVSCCAVRALTTRHPSPTFWLLILCRPFHLTTRTTPNHIVRHGSGRSQTAHSVRCVINSCSRGLFCLRAAVTGCIRPTAVYALSVTETPRMPWERGCPEGFANSSQLAEMPSQRSSHGDYKQPMPATSHSCGSQDTRVSHSTASRSSKHPGLKLSLSMLTCTSGLLSMAMSALSLTLVSFL